MLAKVVEEKALALKRSQKGMFSRGSFAPGLTSATTTQVGTTSTKGGTWTTSTNSTSIKRLTPQ